MEQTHLPGGGAHEAKEEAAPASLAIWRLPPPDQHLSCARPLVLDRLEQQLKAIQDSLITVQELLSVPPPGSLKDSRQQKKKKEPAIRNKKNSKKVKKNCVAKKKEARAKGRKRADSEEGEADEDVGIKEEDDEEEEEVVASLKEYFREVLPSVQLATTLLSERTKQCQLLVSFMERMGVSLSQALSGGFFAALPAELFLHVLSFLEWRDLCNATLVSKRWRHLADDPMLWRSLFRNQWRNEFFLKEKRLEAEKVLVVVKMDDNAEQPGGGGGGENFASMSEEGEESSLPSSEVIGAVEGEGEGQTNYSKSTGTIKYSRSWKRIYIQRQIAESSWRMGKVKRVTTLVGHTAWISCLHFDENRIVSGAGDKTIRIWQMEDDAPKLERTLRAPRGVLCLQFDEDKIISGDMDNSIVLWDIKTGKRINTLIGHKGRVWALQFDRDKIVSAAADRSIKIWDLNTLQCKKTISSAHADGLSCIKFDSNYIVSGAADNVVKVWDMNTYKCCQTLSGEHGKAVFCVALDGVNVISGSHDSTIKQWDLRTGKCLHTFVGHQNGVFGIQFDDRKMVSCAGDHTIKIWDLHSKECLATLDEHRDAIRAIQYDESKIVSGSSTNDKTIKVWSFV